MDVRILGPLEVWEGSEQLVVDSPRQRSLLALLAIHADEVVSVDRIVDELWGESPPASVQSTVRYHVSKLRSSLGDAATHVVTRSPGYVLEVPSEAIDVYRFEAMAAEGRGLITSEPERAERMLVDALSMWRGSALADFAYESFARAEIVRLEELRLAVLEDRIEADLASGRHVDLVGELEALVGEHPLRERLWGQLMTALYRSGRQAEALRAYQHAREALAEVGIEPSEELRAVEEQVLMQDPLLSGVRRPVRRHNLPERLSSFVGREAELEELRRLLADHRLVTLTGMGGLGKTSLAIEALRPLVADIGDGVWIVSLSDVASRDLIPERLADVLDLQVLDPEAIVDRVEAFLESREVVLLFDACERHIDSVASLIERLLAAAPNLRILATSREPLQLGGEARFKLRVLECDGQGAEATRLFLDRAALADPHFEPTPAIAEAVSRLCSRLAGIPLAIELSAARLGSLTLQQITDRLDGQMALLVRGRGNRIQHDSMQATLDWSHDLLDPVEQAVFRRLAAFRREFSPEAAERVCGGGAADEAVVADILARLVDASLLVLDRQHLRFLMLDPVRQYAEGQLRAADEAHETRLRHCEYHRDLAGLVFSNLYGPDELEWLHTCELAEPDHVAALDWALANDQPTLAVEIAASLSQYWNLAGRAAIEDRFLDAISEIATEMRSRESVIAITHCSFVAYSRGDDERALSLAETAMELATELGDEWALSCALRRLGAATPEIDKAIALTRQAIELQDDPYTAVTQFNLVEMLCLHVDETGRSSAEAEALANRMMADARESGSMLVELAARAALAEVAWMRGDVGAALAQVSNMLPIDRQFGIRRWVADELLFLAEAELELGNTGRAAAYLQEARPLHNEIWGSRALRIEGLVSIGMGEFEEGVTTFLGALSAYAGHSEDLTAGVLFDVASICFAADRHEPACCLYAATQGRRDRLRLSLPAHLRHRLDEHRDRLLACLGSERFADVWGGRGVDEYEPGRQIRNRNAPRFAGVHLINWCRRSDSIPHRHVPTRT